MTKILQSRRISLQVNAMSPAGVGRAACSLGGDHCEQGVRNHGEQGQRRQREREPITDRNR
jgi:hypothetical protein